MGAAELGSATSFPVGLVPVRGAGAHGTDSHPAHYAAGEDPAAVRHGIEIPECSGQGLCASPWLNGRPEGLATGFPAGLVPMRGAEAPGVRRPRPSGASGGYRIPVLAHQITTDYHGLQRRW